METVGWKSVDLTGFLTVECDEDGRRGEVWTFRFEGGRSTGVRPGCAGAWAVADADAAAVLRRVRKMLEPGREAPYGDLRAVLDAACGPDQAP